MRTYSRALSRIPKLSIAALALVLAASPVALAQEEWTTEGCSAESVGCFEQDVSFRYREGFLDSVMLDTGWVPSGSPVQVRFSLHAGGQTEVGLAGRTQVWWPTPLSVAVPGEPDSGEFSIDYGLEISARVRFDVSVAGTRYTWEGDIPIGSIPRDLRMAASAAFDSMLMTPSTPRPIAIEDATDRVRLFDGNIAGLIGIPGVSGGFAVEAQAQLAAAYRTDMIEVTDATTPIAVEGGATVVGPDEGEVGFGASKDVVVRPIGFIDYEGSVALTPTLYVSVAGRRFDLDLTTIDVPLLALGREARFNDATVHVPLPDVRIEPRAIDFGEAVVGARVGRLVDIRNEGEATLHVRAFAPRAPFEVGGGTIDVPPSSTRRMEIVFEPTEAGAATAMLQLSTDDPDESRVVLRLSGSGVESPSGDAGPFADAGVGDAGYAPSTDGGCACRVGQRDVPRGGLVLGGLVALTLVVRRRRR